MPLSTSHSFNSRFQEYAGGYNFPDGSYAGVFSNLLIECIKDRGRPDVLDIGCGQGLFRRIESQRKMAPLIGNYVGIEPDPDVEIDRAIFGEVYRSTMEEAALPANSIDVAYAAMVVEHVAKPGAFLSAVRRALRPGGIFLFCTPNADSYFGIACRLTIALKMDEVALAVLRRRETVDLYHYPITYRLNSRVLIERAARGAGMNSEVAFSESMNSCSQYFPGPAKAILRGLKWKRKHWKKPEVLTHIIGAIEKPTQDAIPD